MFKIVKKIAASLIVLMSFVFIGSYKAFAEESGPIIIQGVLQKNYNLDMTVHLVDADTEELIKVYHLNEKNSWMKKDKVPVGKYKIYAYHEGQSVRSLTIIKGTLQAREVVEKPLITKGTDKTPRFVVMQGDKNFLDKYYGLVDFVRLNGTSVYGVVTDEDMEIAYKEAIYHQTGAVTGVGLDNGEKPSLANDVAGPEHDHEHEIDHSHINELEAEFPEEKLEEIARPDKIKAEESKSSGVWWIVGVVSVSVVIGLLVIYIKFRK